MTKALKILTIDDDKIDALSIVRSISKSDINAEIDSAYSAKEGFEKLEKEQYDLIFLDYMLPDSDGISILQKIRCLGIEVPVIFITSQGDAQIASQAILAGASDYMPKSLLTADGISHSVRKAIKLYESQNLRKKTELALKINAKRLSKAQKLAKIGSWEINLNDDDVYFSEGMFSILELDSKQKPSLSLIKSCITSLTDLQLFENNLKEIVGREDEIHFSHRIMAKNGAVKHINQYITCINDDTNIPITILGTIQDISEQKQTEKELIQAKNIAENSVKVKERFLTNMSHEIRTPMNGVMGFARILEDTNLDENQMQSIEAIKTAGDNLMVIINDILDFSKIEADMMTFESIQFSLSKTVKSVVELLLPSALKKNIVLKETIDPQVNDAIIGDPTRLSQILINLIGNAVKFTEEGQVELVVTKVSGSDLVSLINFNVIDSGIGIPADKVDSIFESFTQASDETTRKFGGTGLGLTITRKLVELQGGSIVVRSEIGTGSEFSFDIQYKNAAVDNVNSSKEAKKNRDFSFLKDKKILLAEDNKINQLLTRKVFERWDKQIEIAENGLIAFEKIKENDYDIILMDIQMPEMDGNEVTEQVRKLSGHKSKVPIIALTAHATTDEERRCITSGMDDYLSKPYDFNVLLEKLYTNLNLNN
ncbi:response regulator [Flavobacterium muglaense]|uniref:Sensory/regulatory protein RpfC n=1 Tax=Flavobacterium muglaense TaxID=2764716 RepID=A0A923N1B5_9FLAO|nr:response regulator [Flavobacterium muglaense]MBC5838269.1 response regulator [Flavobacterium muglaense]MBC5844804.1 response regulator [Flavobacterium muglaense]